MIAGRKTKDKCPILKPEAVVSYNKNMGGVDSMDAQLDQLHCLRKTYKWYKKLSLRLIMQCMFNSHKLYKLNGGTSDFLSFIHDLIAELLAIAPKLNTTIELSDTVSRLAGRGHFPARRERITTFGNTKRKEKECRVCCARKIYTASGNRVRTTWICSGCPSQPGLCIDKDCFSTYHSKLNYA